MWQFTSHSQSPLSSFWGRNCRPGHLAEVSGDQELSKLPGVTALSLFYMIRTKLPMALNVIRKKK